MVERSIAEDVSFSLLQFAFVKLAVSDSLHVCTTTSSVVVERSIQGGVSSSPLSQV